MKPPKSLSANIANLLVSTPQEFDEDETDNTSAKVLTAESDDSNQGEINERSKIRIQTSDLLENYDPKYAGKVSNRRNYRESESDDEFEDVQEKEYLNVDRSDDGSSEDESEEETKELSSDEESEEEMDTEDAETNDEVNFQNFTKLSSNIDDNKGQHVKNQLNIWESLLEMRIKSKKGLTASNKMPIGEKLKTVFSVSDAEGQDKLSQTQKNLNNLLEKMITLQTLLLKSCSETRNKNGEDDEDEEIPSEEDGQDEPEIKRIKIEDIGKSLAERQESYKVNRNKIIEKWYDKTRIKHIDNNGHTLVNQIDFILKDKTKFIEKTQRKKSNFNIIGEEDNDCNVNIYDDEDFYHQQLRELVEFKSNDITDPLQLSRQWVQLQNMRSKMKRKIDVRATKGRKLRFGVHSKMVNHVATQNYVNSKSEKARKELFISLFK